MKDELETMVCCCVWQLIEPRCLIGFSTTSLMFSNKPQFLAFRLFHGDFA